MAASSFGLLKRERINWRCYATRAEALADVVDYIERFYNRQQQSLPALPDYRRPLAPNAYRKA